MSFFIANSFGTTNQSMGVSFDAEPLLGVDGKAIQGSPYTGTSMNANLLLQKVSNAGSVEWSAYTKKGYVMDCYLSPASDGGLVVAMKVRAWVEEAGLDNLLEYVDGTGATWTGDPQSVIGDLFLVKLDKNGYFTKSLLADGTASCAFFDKMVYADGKIYVNGRVQGDGSAMALGGKAVNASSERQTELLVSINTEDLSVNYVNALTSTPNSASRFVVQNKAAQYIDGYVYFTGLLNGGFRAEGASEDIINNKATMLKPYVLKVNPATGEVAQAAIRTEGGIGGFFGVYEGKENLYAFGYDMGANGGAILVSIKKSDFSLGTASVICKYGMVAVCATPLADGDNLILANRGRATQNPTFLGTDKTFTGLQNWGVVYYSYKISDAATGIDNVKGDAQSAKVDVYTTDGVFVKTASSVDEAKQNLAKGVYVIGNQKVAVE